MKSTMLLAVVCAAGWAVGTAGAQERALPVDGIDLVKSPQRFWARSIVFTDHLAAHPAGGDLRLDRSRVVSFSTREVGRCYAEQALVPVLRGLPLGQRCHFTGTVLQHKGRYLVVVNGVTAALQEGDIKPLWPAVSDDPSDYMSQQALRPVFDILTTVQSAHASYAQEQGIALADIYKPDSVHFAAGMNLVRSSLMAYEQKVKTTSSEILAQYLYLLLAQQAGPAEEATASTAAASPRPEPAVESVEPAGPAPAPEPIESEPTEPSSEALSVPGVEAETDVAPPPKPLTRQEKKELARQARAAAKAEAAQKAAERKRKKLEPPPPVMPPMIEPSPAADSGAPDPAAP